MKYIKLSKWIEMIDKVFNDVAVEDDVDQFVKVPHNLNK